MLAIKRARGTTGAVVGRAAYVSEVTHDTVRLRDGGCARVAASCLLQPHCGDRVLLIDLHDGEAFVHAILDRDAAQPANLRVSGARHVTLSGNHLLLAATDSIELQSIRDIEMTAAAGQLSINARSVTVAALESIVQSAAQFLANMGTYALQVRSLLRLHGQQTILTAEGDMKVDAQRISVG